MTRKLENFKQHGKTRRNVYDLEARHLRNCQEGRHSSCPHTVVANNTHAACLLRAKRVASATNSCTVQNHPDIIQDVLLTHGKFKPEKYWLKRIAFRRGIDYRQKWCRCRLTVYGWVCTECITTGRKLKLEFAVLQFGPVHAGRRNVDIWRPEHEKGKIVCLRAKIFSSTKQSYGNITNFYYYLTEGAEWM